jgi:hypothetical protein
MGDFGRCGHKGVFDAVRLGLNSFHAISNDDHLPHGHHLMENIQQTD